MTSSRILKAATTKFLVFTVFFIILGTTSIVYLILYLEVISLDAASKFIDTIFKATSVLVALVWALNRYFVHRTDEIQLRVDADVNYIKSEDFSTIDNNLALLLLRLDVVNTGNVLIPAYKQFLQIEAAYPLTDEIDWKQLYRWPKRRIASAVAQIEPKSWGAISEAISIPDDVKAIRIYLEIQLQTGQVWSWHKNFSLANKK